jgi:hypothetical protein
MRAYDEKTGVAKETYNGVIPENNNNSYCDPYQRRELSPSKKSYLNNPVLMKGDITNKQGIRVPIALSNI